MAKYKKKRARELKQDAFRDTAMKYLEKVGDRLEGKGKAILYGLAAIIVIAALTGLFIKWRGRKADEARQALGRGITIASASISTTPASGSATLSFTSEQERAQKAIEEFQKVEAKYGDPYRTEARYFIATNLLITDRNKGLTELTDLTHSSDPSVAALSKFSLAQAKEIDGKLDEAATLYRELAGPGVAVITSDSANLRLAAVYEKQGKKKEAADLLFNIVDGARKAKDSEGNPLTQSQAAREAAKELQKLDPDRYAKLTPEAPPNLAL